MLGRAAEKEEITEWLRKPAGALLVNGAWQVGKTFTIRKFLRQASASWLEINLIEHPEIIPSLEQSMTVSDLLIKLSTALPSDLNPARRCCSLRKLSISPRTTSLSTGFRWKLGGDLLKVPS